jgi:hypothetical protein
MKEISGLKKFGDELGLWAQSIAHVYSMGQNY